MRRDVDIALPDGFTMGPVTYDDKTRCLEMLDTWSMRRLGVAKFSAGNIDWTPPDLDIEASFRTVIDAAGQMVGHVEVWDINSPPVDVWLWARVHPDDQGRGIGRAMLAWALTRARNAIDRCPPDVRAVAQAAVTGDDEPTRHLFEDFGLTVVRHYWQMRLLFEEVKLDQPAWPDAVSVRTYNHDADLEAVIQADIDAFRDQN